MSASGGPDSRGGGDDLVGDLIAEVARTHGIAISRDDPVIAVVLLNQLVLRRYLEETVAPAAAAIREATRETVTEIEQLAQAQAHWLEQVSLKDRASFLEQQKTLHDAWKADMEALIAGQNTALHQVVIQAAAVLRAHAPSGPTGTAPSSSQVALPSALSRGFRPWGWLLAGMLLGIGATIPFGLAALTWF